MSEESNEEQIRVLADFLTARFEGEVRVLADILAGILHELQPDRADAILDAAEQRFPRTGNADELRLMSRLRHRLAQRRAGQATHR